MASIFIRTAIIYLILTLSMKIMGKRQIGELEVSELVTTLIISEICSIPIDDPDIPLLNAIIPVIFIVSLEIIFSYIKNRSAKLKKLFDGEAAFIIYRGKFNQDVLKENRLSIEEFFAEMRVMGVGSIEEIEYCFIESNGKMSIFKKSDGSFSHILISDGEVNDSELKKLGLDKNFLSEALGGRRTEEVFLLTVDDDRHTYILLKEEKE